MEDSGVQVMAAREQNHFGSITAEQMEPMSTQEVNDFLDAEERESTFGSMDALGNLVSMPSQHEPGAKLDTGKPDMSLLLMFGKALHEVARVCTGGKIQYSRGGWQDVDDGINRYTAAMLRHTFQEHYEEMDPDLVEYL